MIIENEKLDNLNKTLKQNNSLEISKSKDLNGNKKLKTHHLGMFGKFDEKGNKIGGKMGRFEKKWITIR